MLSAQLFLFSGANGLFKFEGFGATVFSLIWFLFCLCSAQVWPKSCTVIIWQKILRKLDLWSLTRHWPALHLSIDAFTGTPRATDWKRHRAVHGELGFNRWKKMWVYPSMTVNLQPWTARCGDPYNLRLVKRSSELVSLTSHVLLWPITTVWADCTKMCQPITSSSAWRSGGGPCSPFCWVYL